MLCGALMAARSHGHLVKVNRGEVMLERQQCVKVQMLCGALMAAHSHGHLVKVNRGKVVLERQQCVFLRDGLNERLYPF